MIFCQEKFDINIYDQAKRNRCRVYILDSLSRKTTVQISRRTSLHSDELRPGRRFRPQNDKSCGMRGLLLQSSFGRSGLAGHIDGIVQEKPNVNISPTSPLFMATGAWPLVVGLILSPQRSVLSVLIFLPDP